MKSTLLKTLAATSLVATTQAEVHVLGASFKERGVNAPLGVIITNPGTVAATRGYLIMDGTVASSGVTPNKATYIEYGEIRDAGVVTRYYTVDTDFDDFRADMITGATGGKRIYGHMHAPVSVADVSDVLIPFSGTVFGNNYPRKLSFDQTTYQTGASDAVAGPQIVVALDTASTLRSVVSGSANPVNVSATTIAGATAELVARLENQGYVKTLGEAPEITSTFPATVPLTDGTHQTLTVTLDPDTNPGGAGYAAPTYQWYKNDVAISGAVLASFDLVGGPAADPATGAGNYKVVVTNVLGSAISSTVAVTSVTNTFATNLPPTVALAGSNSTTLSVTLGQPSVTPPVYQWFKNNVAIAAPEGTAATYTVTGGSAGITGGSGAGTPYTFRVEITNSAGKVVSGDSVVSVTNVPMSFTSQMNSTAQVSFSGTLTLAPTPNTNPLPKITTYQWMKAPLASPAAFANVAVGDGGQGATLTVNGNNASPVGPGVYRLTLKNGVDLDVNSTTCTVTATP